MTQKPLLTQFEVPLAEQAHPVSVGQEILTEAQIWPQPQGKNRQALVCLDQAVGSAWPQIASGLQSAGWQAEKLELQGSESLKDFKQIYPLYAELLQRGLQRQSLLVAVGGGTIGDALGFVAATYLRGIRWVNVATTMLAQVDSCLGGKTGVNHKAGKNLIGAFHQPAAIVCDLNFLKGLGPRDRVSGLGEMLKYGLIKDPEFWSWLKQERTAILQAKPEALKHAISHSLEIKAAYVTSDVYDLSGIRAELNFGHTFGHAIEQLSGYGYYRHGEAVILGMSMASAVSAALGLISQAQSLGIQTELESLSLPAWPETITAEQMLEVMQHDKKNDGAGIHCLLLEAIGKLQARNLEPGTLLQPMQNWIAQKVKTGV